MSLLDLPNEVIVLIAQSVVISPRSYSLWQIGEMARTCGRLHAVCKHRAVWLHVCDFIEKRQKQEEKYHRLRRAYEQYGMDSFGMRVPWKIAHLPTGYGDTVLCQLDGGRRTRLLEYEHARRKWQYYHICSIRRDARGRAVQIKIGAGAGHLWTDLVRTVRRYSAAQFGWRASSCVPREFWCDPFRVLPRTSVPRSAAAAWPMLAPAEWIEAERPVAENSRNRTAWAAKYVLKFNESR